MGTMQSGFILDFFVLIIMRIAFLHTVPSFKEINDLISDISLTASENIFQVYEYDCLYKGNNIVKALFYFRRFLKKNKIDIVHTYYYIDAYLAYKICNKLKIKVVFSNYFYHSDLKGIKKRIFNTVLKNTNIIFQTETQKKYYFSNYKFNIDDIESCFTLYHAYRFERIDNQEFQSLRDEYFIDDLKYLIGTIGDFSPAHDVMNIFKMVKKLRKTGRNFICLIAGGALEEYDSYYDNCRYYYLIQGLDNYIYYLNHRDDTTNILSQLDAFVYHSDNEAVALPVIEAMVMGVNIVVNDCEMIKELTHNGKYATLFISNDEKDFALKTREVLNNLDDYQLISEIIKEECRCIFSMEKHVLGLKNIYSKLLD